MNDHTELIRTGRIAALTFEPMLLPTLHVIGEYRIRLEIISNGVRFQCMDIVKPPVTPRFFEFMTKESEDMRFQLEGDDYVALRPRTPNLSLPALKIQTSPPEGFIDLE